MGWGRGRAEEESPPSSRTKTPARPRWPTASLRGPSRSAFGLQSKFLCGREPHQRASKLEAERLTAHTGCTSPGGAFPPRHCLCLQGGQSQHTFRPWTSKSGTEQRLAPSARARRVQGRWVKERSVKRWPLGPQPDSTRAALLGSCPVCWSSVNTPDKTQHSSFLAQLTWSPQPFPLGWLTSFWEVPLPQCGHCGPGLLLLPRACLEVRHRPSLPLPGLGLWE